MRQEETIRREILEQRIDRELEALSEKLFGKKLEDASDEQVYVALLYLVKGLEEATVPNDGDKKIYYISAEFLIGKLLSNNLINLGIYEKVESVLKSKGKELSRIEEIEPEPSLGNGGLGRLAACFMDSIATLGLPGEGIGLNYHFGLFKQVFKDRLQTTEKNDWIEKDSWLNKTDVSFDVFFGDRKVTSRLYDIDVVGYNNGVNKLRLFDIESVDESIVKEGITFDKEAIEKNLTLFLYPDDSDEAGNLLRIYQQYFMVSNAAQLILMEMKEKQYDLRKMYDYAVIQINDTHPSMIIPELIRILVNDKAFTMDEAIEVVSKTCAYTNHTILAEALEKWPLSYLEKVVPQLVPIIKELSARVAAKYSDPKVQIIDDQNRVHMAHMDIHYGFSVNGVAAIHTEILKDTELHAFYEIYPEKFNNKTNGITFRRWLEACNPSLAGLIDQCTGGAAENVQVTFNTSKSTSFTYHADSGKYTAVQYKADYKDGATGEAVPFTNLLILSADTKTVDSYGRLAVDLIGSGTGYFVTGGKYVPIKWARSDINSCFTYTLEDGTALNLSRGTTYVGVIPTNGGSANFS